MKKGLTRDPPNQLISLQCSLLIPLKTSENLWFSDVFRGIKSEHWEEMGLRLSNATWSEIAKKNGAWAGTAMRFLNLLIRLAVEFFWIYSIKKVYSICYIPSQIQYLGKIWSHVGLNALSQSVKYFDIFARWSSSGKLKVSSVIFVRA